MGFLFVLCVYLFFFHPLGSASQQESCVHMHILFYQLHETDTKDMAHSEEIITHIKFNHKNILCTYKEYHYIQLN